MRVRGELDAPAPTRRAAPSTRPFRGGYSEAEPDPGPSATTRREAAHYSLNVAKDSVLRSFAALGPGSPSTSFQASGKGWRGCCATLVPRHSGFDWLGVTENGQVL